MVYWSKNMLIRLTVNRAFRLILCSVLLGSCLLSSNSLHAEYFGVQNGRIARFNEQPLVSIEAGYSFGDFGSAEYKQTGVRLNYLISPDVMFFGDIGKSDINRNDETSYGFGFYYSISDYISWSNEIAVKLSYHQTDVNAFVVGLNSAYLCSGLPTNVDPYDGSLINIASTCNWLFLPIVGSVKGTVNNIVIETLFSGVLEEQFAGLTTNWYMSLGLHTLGGDMDGDQELAIGGGFVFPYSSTEFYTGFEYVEQSTIGIGIRYSIN